MSDIHVEMLGSLEEAPQLSFAVAAPYLILLVRLDFDNYTIIHSLDFLSY